MTHSSAKIENMTDEQKERFEFFSRSHFDREVVKKVRPCCMCVV
jgi:hypothetical protein